MNILDSKLEEFKKEVTTGSTTHKNKTWQVRLEELAEQAKNLSLATHIGKLTHSGTEISVNFNYKLDRKTMNFVTSISTIIGPEFFDAVGNSKFLASYKLLSLKLDDGKMVVDHLKAETDLVKKEFVTNNFSFVEIKERLLALCDFKLTNEKTDHRVRQVYFPVNTSTNKKLEYHLLSILRPSGIMTELKTRIDNNRVKQHDKGDSMDLALYDLSDIEYGGNNPQNVSGLNSKNSGKFHLLPSMPPILSKMRIRLPKNSLFSECLKPVIYEPYFEKLNKILARLERQNNFDNRKSFDNTLEDLFQYIVSCVWQIRKYGAEYIGQDWSKSKYYSNLPDYQKILLDDTHCDYRLQERWQDEVMEEIARWIVLSYNEACQKAKAANRTWPDKESWGDDYFNYALEIIRDNKEALL